MRRLLKPRSVALVGASDDPAAIGGAPLMLLQRFGYRGDVHLVSRTRSEVNGIHCASTIDDLPFGVDVAILAIPKGGVPDAIEAAGRRAIGGVIVFSSGYGELDEAGVSDQLALVSTARRCGIAVAGPNCLGLVNFAEAIPLTFGDVWPNRRPGVPGVGIIAQSGAMSLALTYAAQAQDITVSYAISTGNEAVLGIEDYLAALLEEENTRAVILLVEQIRRPAQFRVLASRALERGLALCVLHLGRGHRAREASRSHTGAIAGDQGVLRAILAREGVLFIDSFEEIIDTVGLICKSPPPSTEGVAFMTDSGAAKTLAIDICESIGLALPQLSGATLERLGRELPPFATASNPTDITAMGLNDPSLYPRTLNVLLDDDQVGTVVIAAMPGSERQGSEQVNSLLPAITAADKPVVYTIMGGESPIPVTNRLGILDAGVPLFRSPERALNAVKNLVLLSTKTRAAGARQPPRTVGPLALNTQEAMGELFAKKVLADAGLTVPASERTITSADALKAAQRIGYPVVLKVDSPDIAHKSDVGGVAFVTNDEQLVHAFSQILADVPTRCAGARVTGVLVEKTISGGVEMIVGARRDPDWGAYLLAGLGGVWAEILRDSVIVAADATRPEIFGAIEGLRAFPVLAGARGQPQRDLDALVDALEVIGAILRAVPDIVELEVNPLLVLDKGQGAVVLDALITLTNPNP